MAENTKSSGCLQRDSAEHEGYAKAHRSFNLIWKERGSPIESAVYENRTYSAVRGRRLVAASYSILMCIAPVESGILSLAYRTKCVNENPFILGIPSFYKINLIQII